MILTATAEQCRQAIKCCKARHQGAAITTRMAAWDLLDIIKTTSVTKAVDDDGLEADHPDGQSKEARALRVFENALDWEANFILTRYLEIARELIPLKRRLKPGATIAASGIVMPPR